MLRYTRAVRGFARGFTLVEITIAVAIVGILAGLAITQGLKALERSKQAKAMDDMADLAKYIAGRLSILGVYPPAPLTIRTCATCRWVPYEKKDPWGHIYVYSGGGDTYTLRCLGRDGVPSAGITLATRNAFDLDIVMQDGQFVSQPFTR
ncbi:MAG: prepilin-type N-terminal cleavage/methylation domain-containing protein [Acidobacteriota bacterium]